MHRFHVRDHRQWLDEFLAAETTEQPVTLHTAIILLVSSKTVEPGEALAALLAHHRLRRLPSFPGIRDIIIAGHKVEQGLRHLVLVLLLQKPIAQVPCEERTVRVNRDTRMYISWRV